MHPIKHGMLACVLLPTTLLADTSHQRICTKNIVTTATRVVETLSDFHVVDQNGAYASLAGMICTSHPETGAEECFPANAALIVRNGQPELSYEAANSYTATSGEVLQIESGHFLFDSQKLVGQGSAMVGRVVNGAITWQTFGPLTARSVSCPPVPKQDKQIAKDLIRRMTKASR